MPHLALAASFPPPAALSPDLPPDLHPDLDALSEQIADLAAHLHAATYRLLCLIREFDRRHGWVSGFNSCAHWLAWRTGIELGAAREKVRVARALTELPETSAALAAGQVSYAKVRALTRVATPQTESELLAIACCGTAAHVERVVRGYRRAVSAQQEAADTRARHEARGLQVYWDEAGMLVVRGRLPAEQGARFLAALEAAKALLLEERGPVDVSAETSSPAPLTGAAPAAALVATPPRLFAETPQAQRQADALVRVAEAALADGLAGERAAEAQLVVHVDAEVLGRPAAAGGRSALEQGPHVSAETSRRLACDASLVRLVEGPLGEPLSIGRKTRAVPEPMRRALHNRDRGCRFPGCGVQRRLHAHHLEHWADGGPTAVSNLVELCAFHHRQVHEGGCRVERSSAGALRFFDPRGRELAPAPTAPRVPGSAVATLASANRRAVGQPIGAATLNTWNGVDELDLDWAVSSILWREQRPTEAAPD
ncbi:MAG: DUF222 domain-containing protein [Proteobacteria bacterium]|nr:DUF222 domain-containing protein [Pseudomonadota bacterium]